MTNATHSFFTRAFVAFVLTLAAVPAFGADAISVSSPEGRTKIDVTVDSTIRYSITYDGVRVVGDSQLGLTLGEGGALGALKLVAVETRRIDEEYASIGRRAVDRDRCFEANVDAQEEAAPNRKIRFTFRAYDEGAALRYAFLDDSNVYDANGEVRVDEESLRFAFDENCDVWAAEFKDYASNHEGAFQKRKFANIKPGQYVGRPLVVVGESFIAALTESDLLDWSGLQFTGTDVPGTVATLLAPRDDKRGKVVRKGACASPWRVVVLGKDAVELVNHSDIVRHVATPCAIDTDWIEPGNCSWDWWAPKNGREISDAAAKTFIDFASEHGWRYILIDAGWYKKDGKKVVADEDGNLVVKGLDVPELVEYGNAKNVKLLMWIDWPDIIQVDVRRTLKRFADWGVAGVKIDHMNSHSQEMVANLAEAVKIAAEYRLLVNYHGMYEPTGLERTYPNQITREGVQGNEYFRGRALSMTLVAALPYTRGLIGPADYTPGGFRNAHLEDFKTLKQQEEADASTMVVGTRAHELALCMLFDSPLRCLCDLPRVYAGKSGLDYLDALPASWDDTIALKGEIGEYYVVARRSGEDWYVSAIANERARDVELVFDFLDDATYEATFYKDAPNSDKDANALAIEHTAVNKNDSVLARMARDGGWNVVLKKRQ